MDDKQKLINEKIVLVLYRLMSAINKGYDNDYTSTVQLIDSIYDLIHNNPPAQM